MPGTVHAYAVHNPFEKTDIERAYTLNSHRDGRQDSMRSRKSLKDGSSPVRKQRKHTGKPNQPSGDFNSKVDALQAQNKDYNSREILKENEQQQIETSPVRGKWFCSTVPLRTRTTHKSI